MNENAKVYKEVLLALEVADKSQVSMIPEEVIENIRKVSNTCEEEVKLKYDVLGEVILSREAKAMIVMLYQKYFLRDKERAIFIKKLVENDSKK